MHIFMVSDLIFELKMAPLEAILAKDLKRGDVKPKTLNVYKARIQSLYALYPKNRFQ